MISRNITCWCRKCSRSWYFILKVHYSWKYLLLFQKVNRFLILFLGIVSLSWELFNLLFTQGPKSTEIPFAFWSIPQEVRHSVLLSITLQFNGSYYATSSQREEIFILFPHGRCIVYIPAVELKWTRRIEVKREIEWTKPQRNDNKIKRNCIIYSYR